MEPALDAVVREHAGVGGEDRRAFEAQWRLNLAPLAAGRRHQEDVGRVGIEVRVGAEVGGEDNLLAVRRPARIPFLMDFVVGQLLRPPGPCAYRPDVPAFLRQVALVIHLEEDPVDFTRDHAQLFLVLALLAFDLFLVLLAEHE